MTPFDPRLPIIAAAARVKTCHVYHCWCALKEMGKAFHSAAFANFAGLEEKHVSAILSALEDHEAVPGGRTTSTRGTRLPLDFSMPQEWIDWAIDEKMWSPEDASAEAEIFVDFWHSKSGAGAAKLDWQKTWRNWVRNSRRPKGEYRRQRGQMVSNRDHLIKTAELYERMGRTTEAAEIRRNLLPSDNILVFHNPSARLYG